MDSRRKILRSALAASILLMAGIPANGQSRGERALEGAWQVSVKVKQPAPPFAIDFLTLITYSGGGTSAEYNGTVGNSPAKGEWIFSGGSTFYAKWLKHIRNPQTNELLAIVQIRARISMTSPDEYTSVDKVEVYGPDGQVAASWENVTEGKRIKAEAFD